MRRQRPRVVAVDGPDVVPFARPDSPPVDAVAAVALVPEAGVWDVRATVWPAGVTPNVPFFVYEPTGLPVSWSMTNRVTGQRLDLQPNHATPANAAGG